MATSKRMAQGNAVRISPPRFTERLSPVTGKPYPRCQLGDCDKTVYANGFCYQHFQEKPMPADWTDASWEDPTEREDFT